MSLSEAVVGLVARLRPAINEKYAPILDALETMPHWIAQRDITSWEEHCGELLGDQTPAYLDWKQTEKYDYQLFLLAAIYELGLCNLYTQYREKETRKEYEQVLALFRKYNIPGEEAPVDLSTW